MLKVFVADDEPVILNSIIQMIPDCHSDFEVVGSALNGKDALPLIERLRPDVLFTDIRMPFMDGLTLIEELNKKRMDIIPVILSGYGEFEYAKKAISLGTYEYLLKPLSYEMLEELLSRLYDRIQTKKYQKQSDLLKRLISSNISAQDTLFNEISAEFSYKYYSYILFCIGSYCIFSPTWDTPERQFWSTDNIDSILKQNIPSSIHYWMIDSMESAERILVLASNHLTQPVVDNIALMLYQKFSEFIKIITALAGTCTKNIEDFEFLPQLSRLYLRQNIIYAKSVFITYSTKSPADTAKYIDISKYENTLFLLAHDSQQKAFLEIVHSILNECKDKEISQLVLENTIKKIMHIISQAVSSQLQPTLNKKLMELDELISNTSSYIELADGVDIILSSLFRAKKELDDAISSPADIIEEIKNYINMNYAKSISFQQLAKQFTLNPSQLSSLFKKFSGGITPTMYLTQIRIEKAKELLVQSSLSLRKISEAVGYEDYFYFSRVFKLTVGVSPTKYRAEVKEEENSVSKPSN